MKFLVVFLAATCYAAPQMVVPTPYAINQAPAIVHAQSTSPAVTRIPKPGIRFNMPQRVQVVQTPVQYAAPVPVAAPVEIAAPVQVTAPVQVATPVQYAAPVAVAAPVEIAAPVQVAASVQVATPVQYAAPVAVAAPVEIAAPVQVAAPVAVAAPVEVAAPVQYAAPVAVAVAPEPLDAPEPPMPSLSVPHVGGQFHAQDEAGQYTFGHYGGPNTRVENRDFLGRTSGSFAYVDPVGDVQVRKYAAAPASGFRVAASDLPVDTNTAVQDTAEVAKVKSLHAEAHNAARTHQTSDAVTAV